MHLCFYETKLRGGYGCCDCQFLDFRMEEGMELLGGAIVSKASSGDQRG